MYLFAKVHQTQYCQPHEDPLAEGNDADQGDMEVLDADEVLVGTATRGECRRLSAWPLGAR